MKRDPFAAIADPTRRQIMSVLAKEPLTVNQIAVHFSDISQQAISKQIHFLEKSGLIKKQKMGREQICYLHLEPLGEVNQWVAEMELFWHKKLDHLELFLNQ
jgi:DNA-binding transcriptional ArsR family regulator